VEDEQSLMVGSQMFAEFMMQLKMDELVAVG
jgi:hypothetical protein